MKNKKEQLQFRYYEIPQNQPVLALLGDKWIQNYGNAINYKHFHNYMEIGFCYGGQGALLLDNEPVRFGENMFSVIPKNYPHHTTSDEGTISRWEYLFVDVESFINDIYKDNPLFAEDIIKRINSRAFFVEVEEYPEMGRMVLDICNEMRNKKEFYVEAVRGILHSLLISIARMNKKASDDVVRNQVTSITQVAKALDYISKRYHEEISVADLAEVSNLSETHFRRVFEKSMNMTPVDYLNLVRVQMACEYMRKNDDPMERVAEKCGFRTVSTFNRNFKKVLKISPYQWKIHPENYESKLLNYKISAHKGW